MHTGARAHTARGDNEPDTVKNSCYIPSQGSVSFKKKNNNKFIGFQKPELKVRHSK